MIKLSNCITYIPHPKILQVLFYISEFSMVKFFPFSKAMPPPLSEYLLLLILRSSSLIS